MDDFKHSIELQGLMINSKALGVDPPVRRGDIQALDTAIAEYRKSRNRLVLIDRIVRDQIKAAINQ